GAYTGRRVLGRVTGAVALRDLHRRASLGAELALSNVVLDHTELPRGFVRVVVRDGAAAAGVRLEQKDGYAEVTAKTALAWGAELAPAPDTAKGLAVHVAARNFRADAAMPFVQGAVGELDGRVDADVRARLEPKAKEGQVSGALTLRDGVLEVPSIGERFHGISAKVTMRPWGTLRIDDVVASAPTGRLTAAAQAKFVGLSLRGATAAVHIEKGDKIPIAIEGVPMGSAYGDVKAIALLSPDGKRMNVNVDVPMLGVDLPQSTGHAVQALEPDDHLRLGVHERDRFALLPMGPPKRPPQPGGTEIHAAVRIGEARIRRDTSLDATIKGNPVFDVDGKTVASGAIRILRGTLEVQGKRFAIDHGVVSFTGDPSEPEILAEATWDAPDGTRVYADFAGTPKSGKLSLRSEPERTQDEIVALILFGSTSGQLGVSTPGSQQESTAATGAGVAGGVVTQAVNKAISGVTSADIQTRVDTSEADNPRPELLVQLSKNVSAEVAYNTGVPPPGQAPDRTDVTVDWRFYRNYSLDATVGDQGSTALDLVWRLRY
ncbi:MAG TPA: translocation/assembly module TamB domain-containing protein, partial [Minicystis sp.]|nr:translocation/assembly module TamB domain-containing protein [Minicystis sp.]